MAVSIPQEDPLQPGPERENASTVLGFEPGTGVIMATIVADVPAGTIDGAVNCKEKLLVMVSVVDALLLDPRRSVPSRSRSVAREVFAVRCNSRSHPPCRKLTGNLCRSRSSALQYRGGRCW